MLKINLNELEGLLGDYYKIRQSLYLWGKPSSGKTSMIRQFAQAKAKELGITDLQHAENGGEYHIKELGYWVDGYSEEKNIVIEYYESFHEKQKERDERRKQEIIEFLGCKFIEIKE